MRGIGRGVRGVGTVTGALLGLGAVGIALFVSWVIASGEMELALMGTGLVVAVVITLASDSAALYLLIFAMLLGPQFLAGGLGPGGSASRGLTLRLDDFLLSVIGIAWLAKSAVRKELGIFPRTPLNQPIVLYVVAAILATAGGIFAGRGRPLVGTFFTLKYIQYFIIYFMAVNFTRERRQIHNFLVATLVTCVLASIVSLVTTPLGERLSAPFEQSPEPNTFGGYLVLMVALSLGLHLTARTLRWRATLLLVGAFTLIPLIGTLSRSSYLAVPFVLLTLFSLTDRKPTFAFVLLAVTAAALAVVPDAAIKRVTFTWSQAQYEGQVKVAGVRLDTSTSDRLRSWQDVVLEDFPKQPLLGHGVTGYRFLDAQYPRVLAEMGMVGFFAFAWLQWQIARVTYRIYRGSKDWLLRGLALGVFAGFVGLVFHSIGSNTFIIVRIMSPFWFLMGLVVSTPAVEAASEAQAESALPAAPISLVPAGVMRPPGPPLTPGRAVRR